MHFSKLKQYIDDRSGVAAIEFAIMSPVLMIALIMVVDLGLAIHERMELDQSLRTGAEFAMSNVVDEATLEKMIVASASGSYVESEGDQGGASSSPYTAKATTFWFCPEKPETEVDEDYTGCADSAEPSKGINFELKEIHTAIFLGDMELKSSLSVQVE